MIRDSKFCLRFTNLFQNAVLMSTSFWQIFPNDWVKIVDFLIKSYFCLSPDSPGIHCTSGEIFKFRKWGICPMPRSAIELNFLNELNDFHTKIQSIIWNIWNHRPRKRTMMKPLRVDPQEIIPVLLKWSLYNPDLFTLKKKFAMKDGEQIRSQKN